MPKEIIKVWVTRNRRDRPFDKFREDEIALSLELAVPVLLHGGNIFRSSDYYIFVVYTHSHLELKVFLVTGIFFEIVILEIR